MVAALRQAGIEVQSWPMVSSVSNSGAAIGILEPGDLIKAVDGRPTRTLAEVQAAISRLDVGDDVEFLILRDGVQSRMKVTTRSTATEPDRPIVGITLDVGYSYDADRRASPSIRPIGGSSAGLMFALAINDKLTEADLAAGRSIAGSGTMAADGTVGPIGGCRRRSPRPLGTGPPSSCCHAAIAPMSARLPPESVWYRWKPSPRRWSHSVLSTEPAKAASVKGC